MQFASLKGPLKLDKKLKNFKLMQCFELNHSHLKTKGCNCKDCKSVKKNWKKWENLFGQIVYILLHIFLGIDLEQTTWVRVHGHRKTKLRSFYINQHQVGNWITSGASAFTLEGKGAELQYMYYIRKKKFMIFFIVYESMECSQILISYQKKLILFETRLQGFMGWGVRLH